MFAFANFADFLHKPIAVVQTKECPYLLDIRVLIHMSWGNWDEHVYQEETEMNLTKRGLELLITLSARQGGWSKPYYGTGTFTNCLDSPSRHIFLYLEFCVL